MNGQEYIIILIIGFSIWQILFGIILYINKKASEKENE